MTKRIFLMAVLVFFVVSGFSRIGIAADQQKDPHAPDNGMPPPVATFSILGYDPETGEVGGAVQSRVFTLTGVLTADADAGVVATQAIVDVSYGPKGIALLKQGLKPDAIIKAIWDSDPDPEPERWTKQGRQFAVINLKGETATFTGPKATTWAGGKQGKYCTAQGNILAGEGVVTAMAESFEKSTDSGKELGQRLLDALEAGQAAGGDKRGMQSAALLVVREGWGYAGLNDRYRDLRVDDHPNPIVELQRLYDLHKRTFPPPRTP